MAGEYDFLAPPDSFKGLPQNTPQTAVANARAQGYNIRTNPAGQPNQATSYVPGQYGRGVPVYTPISSGIFSTTLLDQAGKALGQEIGQEQGAANRQFVRNTQDARGLLGTAFQQSHNVLGEANFESGLLSRFGDEAKGYGQQAVESATRNLTDIRGYADRMEGQGQLAMGQARAGIDTATDAIGAYQADVHNKISADVMAINRAAKDRMSIVESGVQPDGQPLSAAERWQMHRETSFDIGQQSATVAANAWQQARDAIAGLKMNLANVQETAAQTDLAAGQLTKQAGELRLEGGQQQLAAEQLRSNYTNMRSQILNLETSVRSTAEAYAAQLQVNGMQTYADEIYRNPESIVSKFAGLAQLAAIASAPGGRSLPGVNLG